MKRLFLLTLIVAGAIGLLAACGGDGKTCGDGTIEQGGNCVPECGTGQFWNGTACQDAPDCGEGTTFNATTGECEPDIVDCAPGTTLNTDTGECEPDIVSCGPGTVFNDTTGECDPVCAQDEYWDGTTCQDVPTCAAGTEFNVATGECEPLIDACAPGTHLEAGECVPDVICGPGTHDDGNGNCVPNVLPDPQVADDEQMMPEFTLPAAGESISLGGGIGQPTDLDDDGYEDADFDTFMFQTTTGGVWLNLWATSEGATLPAFAIYGFDPVAFDPDWTHADYWSNARYTRYGVNPNGLDSLREVYLPEAGVYVIEVTDYNNMVNDLFGYGYIPVGGDDFTYYMTVENLGVPTPTALDSLPAAESGTFVDGQLAFYTLADVDGDLINALSAGLPIVDVNSDAFPALLLFGPTGALMNEVLIYNTVDDAELLFLGEAGEYLLVQDFLLSIGPNLDFSLAVSARTPTDCDAVDCSTMDMNEGEDNIFTFNVPQFEFFYHSALIPDENYELLVQIFNADGEMLGESSSYPYVDWWTGQLYLLPSSILLFADEDMTIIVKVAELAGQAVTYSQTIFPIPESLLSEGANTGLVSWLFPEWTFYPAGIDQYIPGANKVVIFSDYSHINRAWVNPVTLIMETNQDVISALDAGGYLLDPPMAISRHDGRYVHWHMDNGDGAVPGTYDVTMTTMDVGASLGHLSSSRDTTIGATGLALDANTGYAMIPFSADEMVLGEVVVTPAGALVPDVKVFHLYDSDFVANPEGGGLQSMLEATGANPGEALNVGIFGAAYSGDYYILVSDASGNADPADTFDITITYMPPPGNDLCVDAEPVVLDVNGQASIQTDTSFATNAINLSDYGSSCTGYSTNGNDLFYSIDLVAGQTITVTQTPGGGSSLDGAIYLFTDCDDPNGTCVAGADNTFSGSPETFTYDVTEDNTYIIGADAWSSGGGPITLDISVIGP